jgi:glycosyltransferase involved in cell wall biosynthesis
MSPAISVIVPSHNPDPARLRATLAGLRAQTLSPECWETLLVDNVSDRWPSLDDRDLPPNSKIVRESALGLSSARRAGFRAARAPLAVLVDDDNVLAPDYLENVLTIFATYPKVGVAGGRTLPGFSAPPPAWTKEFHGLLALRDLGENEIISVGLRPAGSTRNEYPLFAPFGAGMALRREAWTAWIDSRHGVRAPSDRLGTNLSSSGDNDIVLCAMRSGWEAGYFPQLQLTHLIPPERLEPGYLARLNRGVQQSWIQVLSLHDACPWPPLSRLGAAFRKARAWCRHRPWTSPAARIRWQGACGHFDGRVSMRE